MYEWNRHKTLEKAMAELEELFATGQVCEGERPFIGSVYVPGYGKRYIIYVGHDED